MNICIYCNYKVHCENSYDYIADYDLGEATYATEVESRDKEMNGSELIKMLSSLLSDSEFLDITCIYDEEDKNKQVVLISLFEPMHGTGSRISIIIEEMPVIIFDERVA